MGKWKGGAEWIKWNNICKTFRIWHIGNPHKGLDMITKLWWQKPVFIAILLETRLEIYLSFYFGFLNIQASSAAVVPRETATHLGSLQTQSSEAITKTGMEWSEYHWTNWPKIPLLRGLSWIVLLFHLIFSISHFYCEKYEKQRNVR